MKNRDRARRPGPERYRITEPDGTTRRAGVHAALRAEQRGRHVTVIPTTRQRRSDRTWHEQGIGTD